MTKKIVSESSSPVPSSTRAISSRLLPSHRAGVRQLWVKTPANVSIDRSLHPLVPRSGRRSQMQRHRTKCRKNALPTVSRKLDETAMDTIATTEAPAQAEAAAHAEAAAPAEPPAPVKVLFVGNSFTTRHNIPQLIADKYHSLHEKCGAKIVVDVIAKGGASLALWNNDKSGNFGKKLKSFQPSIVVLQEQSSKPWKSPDKFRAAASKLCAKLATTTVRSVLLYQTTPWQQCTKTQEKELLNGYFQLAHALAKKYSANFGISLAPVGDAWLHLRRALVRMDDTNPLRLLLDRGLWDTDGKHPGIVTAHLAAAVFSRSISFEQCLMQPSAPVFMKCRCANRRPKKLADVVVDEERDLDMDEQGLPEIELVFLDKVALQALSRCSGLLDLRKVTCKRKAAEPEVPSRLRRDDTEDTDK